MVVLEPGSVLVESSGNIPSTPMESFDFNGSLSRRIVIVGLVTGSVFVRDSYGALVIPARL